MTHVPGLDEHLDWNDLLGYDEVYEVDDVIDEFEDLDILDAQYVTGDGTLVPDYYEYWPEDSDD